MIINLISWLNTLENGHFKHYLGLGQFKHEFKFGIFFFFFLNQDLNQVYSITKATDP